MVYSSSPLLILSGLVALATVPCWIVNAQDSSTKIVTNRADFAYQVSVQFLGSHICGGTIINTNHLVTAASCVFDNNNRIPAKSLTAVVGNLNMFKSVQVHNISGVYVHEDYSANGYKMNNIAVLRVRENFVSSNTVKSIPVITATPGEDIYCKLSGWGATGEGSDFSADLQTQNVAIVSQARCTEAYPNIEKIICAGLDFANTCEGDIGGPLVYNNKLVGIVSGGKSCGSDNTPRLYTEASKYSEWIQAQFAKEDNSASAKSLSGVAFGVVLGIYCLFL